jgi:hypothetical protein
MMVILLIPSPCTVWVLMMTKKKNYSTTCNAGLAALAVWNEFGIACKTVNGLVVDGA